jgi:hypothetical protein
MRPSIEFASSSIGRFAVRSGNHAAARRAPTLTGSARLAGKASLTTQPHLSGAEAYRRTSWRWLVIGALLLLCVGITIVYVATVTADVRLHHWASALDASRDAVPAAVGWAALLIVFFARGGPAEQLRATDEPMLTERKKQTADAQDSVLRAEQRVDWLAARLAELSTIAAQASQNQQLARQIGATAARLEQAEQWLIGARAALVASQRDTAKTARSQPDQRPSPRTTTGRVA